MKPIRVWRITHRKYADTAFSGEGARLFGGRFNSEGQPAVYTSGSLSLALLEIFVQTNDRAFFNKAVLLHADIPARFIHSPSTNLLPDRWDEIPYARASQLYGDRWLAQQKFTVLKVPSVVVPQEYNFVINPLHQDFDKIKISNALPLPLDPRFFEKSIYK